MKGAQKRENLAGTPPRTRSGPASPPPLPQRTSTASARKAAQTLREEYGVGARATRVTNQPEPESAPAESDPGVLRADTTPTAEVGSAPVQLAATVSDASNAPYGTPVSARSLSRTPPPIPRSEGPPPSVDSRKGTRRRRSASFSEGTPAPTISSASFDPSLRLTYGDTSRTVSDPATLSALDRVASATDASNILLQGMNVQTQAKLAELTDETRKLVLNDPRMNADEVSTVVDRIKQNPDVAGLVQAGLVRPEQLKDEAYVLSLKSALANRRDDGRPASLRGRVRRSAAPVFERSVPSRRTSGLKYFKPAMHVRPSIFAAA